MSTTVRAATTLCAAVVLTLGPRVLAAQEQPKGDASQRADVAALSNMADDLAAGNPAASGVALTWEQQHFMRAQEDKIYVPFTVAVDAASVKPGPVGLYLRVAARGQKPEAPPAAPAPEAKKGDKPAPAPPPARPTYAYEDVFFFDLPAAAAGQPYRLRRAFAVDPGEYDVYVALKQRDAGAAAAVAEAPKAGVIKHELTVPALDGFTTSSVIIAERTEVLQAPISNDRQAENPYTFGSLRITPSPENKFTKADELGIVFWIYGAGETGSKPDVVVEYKFHQKLAEGEKYFNRTEPQEMNAKTLPAEFSTAAGHQLPGNLEVPLASFPEGDYRLEITIQDKIGGETITRDVSFSVAAQ